MRSAVRARSRKQMEKLCEEFFDAVDDFLFQSGTNGQFAQDSSYLKAMRELRAKQSVFVEVFLQITLATLFPLNEKTRKETLAAPRHLIDRHAAAIEMTEIDLALSAMHRKSEKFYGPLHEQVESAFSAIQSATSSDSDKQFALVSASLWAFGEAQRVLSLPLEIRLVVIKLFEQNFLMQLQPAILDVINLLKTNQPEAAKANNLTAVRFRSQPAMNTGIEEQGKDATPAAKPQGKALPVVDAPASPGIGPRADRTPEASISPSGKQILDSNDLREISDLLNGTSSESDLASPSMEEELLGSLPDLDKAGLSVPVNYKIDGEFQVCNLKKHAAKTGMYNITDRHSKITITRSKLGLAISLRAGELTFADTQPKISATKTLFDTSASKPLH